MIPPEDRFHTYVDGCSFTSGYNSTINRAWWRYIKEPTRSAAWPGKDNFSIFNDTVYALTNYPIQRVIIYWTYPERFNLPYNNNHAITNWPNKKLQPAFIIDKCFYDYLKMNLTFMYSIQQICKEKDVELYNITTLPYHYYENGDNGLVKEIKNVANWPGPYLNASYHVWVNSLQILFGSYHNVIDSDGMHINATGHQLFYTNFIHPLINKQEIEQPWSTNNALDWIYNLTPDLQKEAFSNSRVGSIEGLTQKTTTDFVYEQI